MSNEGAKQSGCLSKEVKSHNPRQCLTAEEFKKVSKTLQKIMDKTGWTRPNREFMDDPNTEWRHGKCPDYTLADLNYMKGKSQNHAEGSLERIVEDKVKTWEFEITHKIKPEQCQTMAPGKFSIGYNQGCSYSAEQMFDRGTYNVLLENIKEDNKKYYDTTCSFADSTKQFTTAFQTFSWEVVKVFSGPPVVSFSWRHWGKFDGKFNEIQGQGQHVEVFGFAMAEVNDKLQFEKVMIYYDADEFIEQLVYNKSSQFAGTFKSLWEAEKKKTGIRKFF